MSSLGPSARAGSLLRRKFKRLRYCLGDAEFDFEGLATEQAESGELDRGGFGVELDSQGVVRWLKADDGVPGEVSTQGRLRVGEGPWLRIESVVTDGNDGWQKIRVGSLRV